MTETTKKLPKVKRPARLAGMTRNTVQPPTIPDELKQPEELTYEVSVLWGAFRFTLNRKPIA